MIIKLLVEGGNMKPNPALAQQLGPKGINLGKVISDINIATKEFQGITVPVNLDVDTKTKDFKVIVLSPPTSQLIKKELGIELASGERKKLIVGNLAIEQVISVAKAKHNNMLAKEFISALKSVIGSCLSMGVIIENKDPKEILQEIAEGKYASEIKSQKTELSEDKKAQLKKFFSEIKSKQESVKKKEEEEKAAAEQAKADAATAKPAAATAGTATKTAAATPAAAKAATPAAATAKSAAKPAAAKKGK